VISRTNGNAFRAPSPPGQRRYNARRQLTGFYYRHQATLTINDSLTLTDIPPAVFDYRLGNRSALDWVIDQYQIYEDMRSGSKSDPDREDDPDAFATGG
jgi:predicted helicase